MNESQLRKTLTITGWATVFAYPIKAVSDYIYRYELNKTIGLDDPLIQNGASLFAFIFDSPFFITPGILCLFAASYLKKKPQTLQEIFE